MVFVKCKRNGLKIPKFDLVFLGEPLEVSDEIAEVLLRENAFSLVEGSKLKTKKKKNIIEKEEIKDGGLH